MAEIPEARNTPTSARPEELDSPVPVLGGLSPTQLDLIKTNLVGMSPDALDKFFADKGLSDEQQGAMRALVEQLRAAEPKAGDGTSITAAAPSVMASAPMAPAAIKGTGLEEGQVFPQQMPGDLLNKIKNGLVGDIGVGLLADVPGVAAGLGVAGALTSVGLPLPGAVFGALTAGTIGAMGGSEAFENTLRHVLGMKPHEYAWWENGLAATSGVAGVAAKTAMAAAAGRAALGAKETKAAVEGAAQVKKATDALVKGWGKAKALTEEEMTRLVGQVDDMFENRVAYYKSLEGLDDLQAGQRALADVPKFIQKYDGLNEALNLAEDLTPAKFKQLQPGKQFVKGAMALSKERMVTMRQRLSDSVEGAINAARKGGGSAEGLVVPFEQVRGLFNELITDAAPLFPALKDGRRIVFREGQFALQKGQRIIPIDMTDKETLKRVRATISENPYLKELFKQYRLADNAFSRVVAGEAGAIAEAPVSLTLGQIGDLRAIYSGLKKEGGFAGRKLAQDRVYYKLNQLENRYLDVLESSDNFDVVQNAMNYRQAKDLSRASSEVFDDMIKNLNNDPSSMARAFSAISDDQARQFMRLKREVVPGFESAIVDEDMPQYIARKILEDRFGAKLFGKATKVGGVSQDLVKELPNVISEIKADKNLVSKMEIYLGKESWKNMLSGIERTVKFADEWTNKLEMVKKSADPKALNAVVANTAVKAAEIIATGAGIPGVSQVLAGKQYWLTKLITDSMGVPAVMKKVNQVVYTKYIDDVVKNINTTKDAMRMRVEIIDSFGDNPVGRRVLQGFDERARSILQLRMSDVLSPGSVAAGTVDVGAKAVRMSNLGAESEMQ